MKIEDSDIRKICTDSVFRAGSDYFREGRVHIRVRGEDKIVAAVDADRLYNVHIGFDKNGRIAETFCTCPYYQTMSSNCKHIAAVLTARTPAALNQSFVFFICSPPFYTPKIFFQVFIPTQPSTVKPLLP